MAALQRRPPPGLPPRLTVEQRGQIPALLAQGAEAHGFRGEVWTATRVAEVIRRTFGVRYHRDHVSRLLRQLGWSRQQPVQRATQREAQAIHSMRCAVGCHPPVPARARMHAYARWRHAQQHRVNVRDCHGFAIKRFSGPE